MARRISWLIAGAALLLSGFVGFAAWLDAYGFGRKPRSGADAIVVLGCRVNPDGRASSALATRARRAAHLYAEGVAPRIVVTGGVGDHAPSEAEAARRVLLAEGVPDSAILVEDTSTSTEENLAFARARFGGRSVVVVSDAYHVFRAERTARKYFAEVAGVGTRNTTATRVRGSLREVIAVLGYAALGRLRALDGPHAPARPVDHAPPRCPRGACILPTREEGLEVG